MKRKTVISNLRAHLKWAAVQTPENATEKAADKAEDICSGILDILEVLPTVDFNLDKWLDRSLEGRRAPRRFLDDVRNTYFKNTRTIHGRKALTGLITVTIEVLEADTWVDEIVVGCLPVKMSVVEPRGLGKQLVVKVDSEADIPDDVEGFRKLVKTGILRQRDQCTAQAEELQNESILEVKTQCFNPVGFQDDSPTAFLGNPETKICRVCREEQSASDFYAHPKTADGLQNACKACLKAAVQAKRQGVQPC